MPTWGLRGGPRAQTSMNLPMIIPVWLKRFFKEGVGSLVSRVSSYLLHVPCRSRVCSENAFFSTMAQVCARPEVAVHANLEDEGAIASERPVDHQCANLIDIMLPD